MAPNREISTLLRSLGLTETEADVYLALLQAARGEPVSGYKVAKSMGRDPANLAKTLASLGKRGAVRVVQEKPRLFLPVPPDEFTGHVLERLTSTRNRAVELLREFETTPTGGTALALTGPNQVLERARLLLGNCRLEALVFASPGVCAQLSALLENLATERNCRVRIISTQSVAIPAAEVVAVALPAGLDDPEQTPWLQLVVDRETWLIAQLRGEGTPLAPSGWWSEDTGLSLVLAASLATMGSESFTAPIPEPEQYPEEPHVEPEVEIEAEPETEFEPQAAPPQETEFEPMSATVSEPVDEPLVEPEAAVEPIPPDEAEPATPAKPALTEAKDTNSDDEEDDGFQFIIRHEEG